MPYFDYAFMENNMQEAIFELITIDYTVVISIGNVLMTAMGMLAIGLSSSFKTVFVENK